ncbi:hypothetical protein Y032_0081g1474 [Ancylostoma ceylanicum]|uniref:Uncharacterized protein n=1 Tax=Ancylostoma ceylanicum TaxID=53326 RepID=A0A016TS93_9BILA|nr:hypothetical protein Y032_0081g1474 [Ancylostoma ceylanicum]
MQRKDPPPAPPSHWWFLAGTMTVNTLMFWAFYVWQRYKEEGWFHKVFSVVLNRRREAVPYAAAYSPYRKK